MSDADRDWIEAVIACLETAVAAGDEIARLRRAQREHGEASRERFRTYWQELLQRPSPFVKPGEPHPFQAEHAASGVSTWLRRLLRLELERRRAIDDAAAILNDQQSSRATTTSAARLLALVERARGDRSCLRRRRDIPDERAVLREFQAEMRAQLEETLRLPPNSTEEELAPGMRASMESAGRFLEWSIQVTQRREAALDAWEAECHAALVEALAVARGLADLAP